MKSNRCVNTAATLQAVYLVWLFLRITTMCNLSVFGLVRGKFPESFAHAQAVDTRPLFSPNTWPGYEATLLYSKMMQCITQNRTQNYCVFNPSPSTLLTMIRDNEGMCKRLKQGSFSSSSLGLVTGGNVVSPTQNFPSIGGKRLCQYPHKIFPPWEE